MITRDWRRRRIGLENLLGTPMRIFQFIPNFSIAYTAWVYGAYTKGAIRGARKAESLDALRNRFLWVLLALSLAPILATGFWYGQQMHRQYLDRALIAAVKNNDTVAAIVLLRQGANANATDRLGSPLTLRTMLADFLDRLKGKPHGRDLEFHDSALLLLTEAHDADKRWDNPALVRALLDHGAEPGVNNPDKRTPLLYAAWKNYAGTVKVLLERHINPDPKDIFGTTPLMTADVECARSLLAAGADVNARDNYGKTPLMCQCELPQIRFLVDHKADVNARNADGQTALIGIIEKFGEVEPACYLIHHDAKVSISDRFHKTALDYARGLSCKKKHISEAQKHKLIRMLQEAARDEHEQQHRRR